MLLHWLGLSIPTNKSKVQWRSLELDKAQRRISISLSTKAKQNFRPLKIKCKFSVVFFLPLFFQCIPKLFTSFFGIFSVWDCMRRIRNVKTHRVVWQSTRTAGNFLVCLDEQHFFVKYFFYTLVFFSEDAATFSNSQIIRTTAAVINLLITHSSSVSIIIREQRLR